MFNFCFLTGQVLNEPERLFFDVGYPVLIFNMGIRAHPYSAGWVAVVCVERLAEEAAKHLHKGSRVVVVGFLSRDLHSPSQGEWVREVHVTALHIGFTGPDRDLETLFYANGVNDQ